MGAPGSSAVCADEPGIPMHSRPHGFDSTLPDENEQSVPHICPRSLRAYVGREEAAYSGLDFRRGMPDP